jgi:hypothetical protein
MRYLLMLSIALFITGCLSGVGEDTSSTVTTPIVPNGTSPSETTLASYEFNTSTEGWNTMAGASVTATNGYLSITGRSAAYDGPGKSLLALEANKMYLIRLNVRPKADTSLNLMLKLVGSSIEYRQLTRSVAKANAWTPMRAFVYLSNVDIAKGLTLYLNGDDAGDFDIDNVTISSTTYTPPTSSLSTDFLNASTARMKGINLIAYTDTESDDPYTFMNYAYYNYDRNDFTTIKSWGFNTVRIALWHKYFDTPLGYAWLDTVIGWAKEARIKVILDMHAPQGGGFQGPNHITPFWDDVSYRNSYKTLWVDIATRYRNEPTVAAYDLINEPCPHTQNDYITLMQETITAIRAVDTNHIINVENTFAADSTPFHLANVSNILYDFHFYDPWNAYTNSTTAVYGTGALTKANIKTYFTDFSDYYTSRNLPLMVSEFGQKRDVITAGNRGALQWVSDVFSFLDETNASYCYFSFKGNEFGVYDSTNSLSSTSGSNTDLINLFKQR